MVNRIGDWNIPYVGLSFDEACTALKRQINYTDKNVPWRIDTWIDGKMTGEIYYGTEDV